MREASRTLSIKSGELGDAEGGGAVLVVNRGSRGEGWRVGSGVMEDGEAAGPVVGVWSSMIVGANSAGFGIDGGCDALTGSG